MRHFASFAAALVAALVSGEARASCPTGEPVLEELTCSSTATGRITYGEASDLGGSCSTRDCYSCGTPYANLTQRTAEDVYSFTCQRSGDVTLDISGLDCDLDIYILDSTCDPYTGCEDGSTAASTTTDSVTFACTAGDTYYVVIEGYGFGTTSTYAGYCRNSTYGDYTLTFDVTAGTGCSEDCDNATDDDYDGLTDCDDSDCASDPVCACDLDGDGYDMSACGGSDCNDSNYYVNPGATETCNSVDDDCDGSVDGGVYDPDGDGYTSEGGDCAEEDGSAYPGAPEEADGVDDDCDGVVDEGTSAYDDDGDGWSEDAGDCADADADVNPGEEDVENGLDDDCDGVIDEGGVYTDDDGDGYADAAGDCDDADPAANPDADETENGLDDDCDGQIDEGFDDSDGDGYGVGDGDCNDLEGWQNPGQVEVCDGLDNNCDGVVDEGCGEDEKPLESKDPGCGCGVGLGAEGGAVLVGLLALALRRRRAA